MTSRMRAVMNAVRGDLEQPGGSGAASESAPETTGGSPTRNWRAWAGLALTCLLVFGLPAVLLRGEDKAPFAADQLRALTDADPEYVFIGNSLLETRIDPGRLSRALGGASVQSLATPGSQSAIWYLQLKNLVAASGARPRAVFIFFRNDLITRPLARIGGQNLELTESLSPGDEPVFDRVISRSRGVEQQIEAVLEDVYPVQLRQEEALDLISRAAAAPLGPGRPVLLERTDDLFTFANFRDTAQEIDEPTAIREFGDSVEDSFLPAMLDVAEQHGLELVFIRIQARPTESGAARQSGALARYSDELAVYLAARGVGYHDFTGDPDVDTALYYDGYHIYERYIPVWTDLFLERLGEHFGR